MAGDDHEATNPPDAVSESGIAEEEEAEGSVESPTAAVISETEAPRSRPVSTSTQETRVEETVATPSPPIDESAHDHLGFPLTPKKGRGIPEDDGMRDLRIRIHAINERDIPSSEKAKLIHDTLLEKYRASQVAGRGHVHHIHVDEALDEIFQPSTSPGPLESLKSWYNQPTEKFILSESDFAPTFAPIRPRKGSECDSPEQSASPPIGSEPQAPLGCQHYERNVKLQCFTCKKWYTCRFCHDAQEDHDLIRRETRNMLCMLCGTPQKASDACINCGEIAAQYYCNICKLWENRKSKPIYHCNDCGICRRGLGLGKDFFHCKVSL